MICPNLEIKFFNMNYHNLLAITMHNLKLLISGFQRCSKAIQCKFWDRNENNQSKYSNRNRKWKLVGPETFFR